MSMSSDIWRPSSQQRGSAEAERESVGEPTTLAATGLQFEELIAQKPHRWPSSLPSGLRGPDGERMGRGRARSLSFDGVSPYQTGDDPRWVDWRATARSGKLQVKRFAAQSHRARMVVLHLDTSLFFGTKHCLMAKTAALMAARLVFDAQVINEPVGLVCCGEQPVPAKRGRRHLWLLLECIHQRFVHCSDLLESRQETDAHNGDDLAVALEAAQNVLSRGDDICLVDELVTREPAFEDWTKSAVARNHLACYLVRDEFTRYKINAGRYPVLKNKHEPPATWSVAARNVDQANAQMAEQQIQETNKLRALGWQVNFADEILSQSMDSRSQ